ncbi:hypothetical protein [Hungatella effluvii]|uniref:hypothetical protein n=2 Tax=Hungatella TaxID=1649459 RepID=UPI001F56794E|nr:hypothetical protein [Hungatella effluvii]
MGKVIPMLGGGGGTDLDVITATAADVRAGKVIVDRDGNPVTGTEPERGNWTGSVAMNGKIMIPDGHHGGSGYVNGPAVTQRGAWNGSVGMNAQVAVPEGYHNGAGKVSGPSVAYQNADVSGTDRANAINRSCWDGTICLGVRNGHYLNGVNWIQYSDPNFRASNFKKGVPIMGLIGTFEGYVPTPQDLYLRGDNIAGFTSTNNYVNLDYGQITISSLLVTKNGKTNIFSNTPSVNLTGYSYINFETSLISTLKAGTRNSPIHFIISDGSNGRVISDLSKNFSDTNLNWGMFSVPINISAIISLCFKLVDYSSNNSSTSGAIYRIWLS